MSIMQIPDDEYVPIHGLIMTIEQFEDLVNHESPYHFEMINGVVLNMAPPSPEHAAISLNIARSLLEQIGQSSPCRVFQEQRVHIPDQPSVQPDVLVTCDRSDWSKKERAKRNHRFNSPLIVVEILSPSTQDFDRFEKFARYKLCPTLQVYILVSQDEHRVEVYQRAMGWRPEIYGAGQTIQLDPMDLELVVDEIYLGVFEEDEEEMQ